MEYALIQRVANVPGQRKVVEKNEPSRDAWQMWNNVLVQVICIKDKITTGTKYNNEII